MQKEYLSAAAEVLSDQGVDENLGLSNDEASSRLAKTGPNKLEEAEKTPLWKRFFEQMADPMVIMLIVAAVISALTGMVKGEPDFADVAIIMFVVIVNSVLGVVQEAKSEEALEALQEMSAAQSKVLRDGKLVHLPSAELVPGDVIMLEAGDSVPADCRVLESATMKIEEAALTGESVPVEKHDNVIELATGTDDVPLGDRKNMCYMGSTVVYGRGRAVVVGTGMNTEMGKIAGALAEAKEELTPLQVKLAELSRILTIMVIVICVVIFGVDIIRHGVGNVLTDPTALLDTFMVAVSLAVAAIPEGLVAVVTIVLSLGVTKMAKRQAIIRKLSAVETLGCTQTICSDKTGTLTQNKMTVVKHELAAPKEKFLAGMALCSDAQWDEELGEAVGEPTECALVNDAGKAGLTGLTAEHPRVGEAPFDSGRKMMSVVVETLDGEYEQYTKGAPDVVIGLCTHIYEGDKVVPLTEERRAELVAANKAMADKNSLIRQITDAMETEIIPFPGGTMSLGDIERRLRELEQQFQTLLEKAADDPAAYGGQFKEILDEQTLLKERRSGILADNKEQAKANQRIMDAAQTLKNASPHITEWDESAVRQLVETVKILSKDEVAVTLKGGIEICQKIMY